MPENSAHVIIIVWPAIQTVLLKYWTTKAVCLLSCYCWL